MGNKPLQSNEDNLEINTATKRSTLTVGEAAQRLHMSQASVRRLLQHGQLRGLRVFGFWEVSEKHVQEVEDARAAIS